MVGIYSKFQKGLNYLTELANKSTGFINGFVPVLGTALNYALPAIGKIGDIAHNSYLDYKEKPYGIGEWVQNFASGRYNEPKKPRLKISKGIGLAKRPDQLHNRISLKALPPPDDDK